MLAGTKHSFIELSLTMREFRTAVHQNSRESSPSTPVPAPKPAPTIRPVPAILLLPPTSTTLDVPPYSGGTVRECSRPRKRGRGGGGRQGQQEFLDLL